MATNPNVDDGNGGSRPIIEMDGKKPSDILSEILKIILEHERYRLGMDWDELNDFREEIVMSINRHLVGPSIPLLDFTFAIYLDLHQLVYNSGFAFSSPEWVSTTKHRY